MRKLFVALLVFVLALAPASAGQMSLLGAGKAGGAVAYVGPGDVTGWGTAYAFYSMRCWKSSFTGNVAHVRNVGTPATATLLTCSSGGTVNETINALSTTCATACEVDIWYDQSGNSRHMNTNAVTFQLPTLTLNAIATTKPAVTFTPSSLISLGAVNTALAQPITVATIANWTAGAGQIYNDGTFSFAFGGQGSGVRRQQAGSNIDYSGATDNTWQSVQSIWNGGSSSMRIQNSSSSGGSSGTNGIDAANTAAIGAIGFGAAYLTGSIYEIAVVGAAVSGTDQTSYYTNAQSAGLVP